nr:MAG TPA: minor capsid protein [Caudoviricetes sp.]
MRLWAEWEPRVSEGCRAAWEEAVSDEDEAIVGSLSRWAGDRPRETAYASRVAAEAARGMSEVLRRENVALASNLERSWGEAVADAVTRVESGESPRRVLADATARLAALGLETVDYRTGARCRVDAALRRHVVTQANQARNDLLVRRMDEWGVDLVFVSAHYGARPSHAVWQGRVFSRSGSSPKYPPLVESTGYGTAGGLCGVNCRHTMTPYVEGLSRLPSTDYAAQERLTGMTSDEYYAATQAQRRLEARVRETKREVALGEAAGADVTAARVRLGELQGRLREHCRANHLRRDYERERAYGLPEGMAQPRALKALPLEQRERFIPREQRAADTAYDVSRRAVNGPSYRRKFDSAGLPKRTAATCYTEARRILRDRDGTDGERMSVVSWRGGRLVCDTFGSHAQKAQAGLTLSQYERAASTDGGVVIMHNHPASTRPSWADLKSVAANEFVRASLVLCHDGTVYLVSGTSPQLIATYEAILKKLRDQLGGTIPDELVKMRALDELYGRNEVERWLRIRRL